MRGISAAGLFLVAVLPVSGQEPVPYSEWMKSIGGSMAALRRSVEASRPETVAFEAGKLEAAFAKVREFWQKRDAADAVRFSRQAETASAALSKKASEGKLETAAGDLEALAASCGNCHNVHRYQLPDGTFRVF